MTLWRTIVSTFYDPAFYEREVIDPSLGNAFKTLVVVVGIVWTCTLFGLFISLTPWRVTTFVDTVQNMYPRDLVVTIAHGEASINQPEPYLIANPFVGVGSDMPKNVVVFDTQTEFTPKDLETFSTFVLVKRGYFVSQDQQGPRMTAFSDMQATTTLDRTAVDTFAANIRPYVVPMVLIGGFVLTLLASLIVTTAVTVFYVLFGFVLALGVWGVSAIRKSSLSYRQSYKMTLYAMVPIIILSASMMAVGISRPVFMFSVMTLLVAFINMQFVVDREERGVEHEDIP